MQDIDVTPTLEIGTPLQNGRYVISRVLGQGGFGITYEAVLTRLDKRVAIKEYFLGGFCGRGEDGREVFVPLKTNREFFERQRKRFYDEADRLAHLSNPHLVPVHDLFDENGTSYYVMDFIQGKSLSSMLEQARTPFGENEVMALFEQMLDALQCIHSQDPPLCHLDIKPANIMVDDKGHAVLIDFGASKYATTDSSVSVSSVVYTPSFAPVEQLQGNRKNMGPWTDFYSLGATLYALLTRRKPSEPSEILADQTMEKVKSLPLPPSVSPRLRKLIVWMMSFDKTARPQSVAQIRQWLARTPSSDSGPMHGENQASRGGGERTMTMTMDSDSLPTGSSGYTPGRGDSGAGPLPGRKNHSVMIISILVAALLAGGAFWFFSHGSQDDSGTSTSLGGGGQVSDPIATPAPPETIVIEKSVDSEVPVSPVQPMEDNGYQVLGGQIGTHAITMYLNDMSTAEEDGVIGYYYYNERPGSKFRLVVESMDAINAEGSMHLVLQEYTPDGFNSGTFDGQYECRGDFYTGSFTNSKGVVYDFTLQ